MDTASLGTRELDIMTVLWQHRSGTVTEVQAALDTKLAYTTVLTILRNLEAKGFVRRADEGRAHRYFPKVKHQAAQRRAVRRLIDTLFLGSPEALLAQLVDDHDLSADELQRIAKRLGGKSGGGSKP